MLANTLRGLASGFGLIVPQGFARLCELMALVEAEAGVPATARQALGTLHDRFRASGERATALEAAIVAHARRDEIARRLATIPAAGPITAYRPTGDPSRRAQPRRRLRGIAATVTDIGLVPRQHSTGGKAKLGRITKAGNGAIRTSLVPGATAMVFRALSPFGDIPYVDGPGTQAPSLRWECGRFVPAWSAVHRWGEIRSGAPLCPAC